MDWGLVLASQSIETTIDYVEDGGSWGLVVAAADYERAREAILQYRLENRGWPWQQEVPSHGILFDWVSLAWVVLIGLFFQVDALLNLRTAGLMDSVQVGRGQWWRCFTAIWLHADLAHLAANATVGFVLLGLAMGRYGTGVGLLASFLAGAGGNLAACLLAAGPHRSLGASGMVMGALGLLAAQSIALWPRAPRASKAMPRQAVTALGAGLMLFVLLGVAPGTDVVAHAGGFVSGLLLGAVLSLLPPLAQKPVANLAAGLVITLLVIAPWALALRR
jgi:membrane associated rhomboid family serine protease